MDINGYIVMDTKGQSKIAKDLNKVFEADRKFTAGEYAYQMNAMFKPGLVEFKTFVIGPVVED